MGGFVSKCKCRSNSGISDFNDNHREDSSESLPSPKDEAYGAELQSQEHVKKKNLEKDFYSITVAETLNSFRLQHQWTDFTIGINGNHFPVHKNVLAASCEFFMEFFNACEDDFYELTNVKPSALEDVLNFLYLGKCALHEQNVVSVVKVAQLFGLQDLQEASEKYLSSLEKKCLISHMTFVSREESILPAIQEFQVQGLFCDVTLTTSGGRVIPVHKNILAAVSGYFQGLFRSEMKEVHEHNVDFGSIDESVVSDLLCFVYSGEISITLDKSKNLLQACEYLLIESFKRKFDTFLKRKLTVSNFWKLFALAKCFNGLSETTNEIFRTVAGHFWEISKSEEFLEITEAELNRFLSNDDITTSEAQMLEVLIRWYKYSRNQREEPFKRLLHLIHMSSIPDLYLKFLAEKEDVVELASYNGHRLRAEVPLDEIKKTAHFYNLALFGATGDYNNSFACYWLPFAGPWSFISSIQQSTATRRNPLVYADGTLYFHNYSQLYRFEKIRLSFVIHALSLRHFDPMKSYGRLSTFTEEPTPVEDPVTVAFSNYIYFIGGGTPSGRVSTVQRFNTDNQSWELVSSMQEVRCRHFAVNYKDSYIYVFGGVDTSSVERYDPKENHWSFVASMHQPRCDGQACVLTDKILVACGHLACEVYDPLTDEWQIGSFQIRRIYTLKLLNERKDVGTLCEEIFRSDDFNGDSGGDFKITPETDPLGLKNGLPCDKKCYDYQDARNVSFTYYNGVIIVFNFDEFRKKKLRTLKLPVYFVNPETGNFTILHSLPSWPNDVSRGILVPLSRKEMITVLKDYPGNKS